MTQDTTPNTDRPAVSCGGKVKLWLKKYFWEGQTLRAGHENAVEELAPDAPWYRVLVVKHKRLVGFLIPVLVYHFFYWAVAINRGYLYLYKEKYYMTVTMIGGSIIAGMTCAGGGAVAFPVLTLAFSVAPSIARDLSLMVQAGGMSGASFTIFFMKVQIEYVTLGVCGITGLAGLILGLHVVDPLMEPDIKKMVFVSTWFAFAFVLYLLNRDHHRKVFTKIPDMKPWKIGVLAITGFVGGAITSWAGSGLDLCVFSVTTSLFRLSEKIATPTSVILMASNSVIAVFWRSMVMNQVDTEAWEFIAVCFPVVAVCAPFGSLLGTHFHRQVLATCLYVVSLGSLIGGFVVVKQTITTGIVSASVMVVSCTLFTVLTLLGKKLLANVSEPGEYEDGEEDSEEEQNQEQGMTEGCMLQNGKQHYVSADQFANGDYPTEKNPFVDPPSVTEEV